MDSRTLLGCLTRLLDDDYGVDYGLYMEIATRLTCEDVPPEVSLEMARIHNFVRCIDGRAFILKENVFG